jgi:hypothetical protein
MKIMHRSNNIKFTGLLALLLFVCCAGATVVSADSFVIDPAGDTFGTGSVQQDITGISATFDSSSLTFTVHFAGAVFAPSAGDDRSVYGCARPRQSVRLPLSTNALLYSGRVTDAVLLFFFFATH